MDNINRLKESLDRLTTGKYTQADIELFQCMSSRGDSFEIFANHAKDTFNDIAIDTPLTSLEKSKLEEEALQLLNKRKKLFPTLKTIRIAASIAAIFAITWLGINALINSSSIETDYSIIATGYGERKSIELPDGTLVELNSGSTLQYPIAFNKNTRKVILKGEAFFDVARNENAPFIVENSRINIKVLGTSFNVKSFEEDADDEISVETGLVEVNVENAMLKLKANEHMCYNNNTKELHRSEIETHKAGCWREDILQFNNASIKDVAKQLTRRFNCRIKLDANSSFTEKISGSHDNATLESILSAITFITNIKAKTDTDGAIILYEEIEQ